MSLPSRLFFLRFAPLLGGLGLLASCSQNSKSFTARAYHNTTAYYNAYYLADERMGEIERKLWEFHEDDYNRPLQILPTIDSNQTASLETDFDYVIQMARKPVEKHKNSNWVDNGYLLIGKAFLYRGYSMRARRVFKYVNTKSEEEYERDQSVLMLLWTYLDAEEYANAYAAYEYLKRLDIGKHNESLLHKVRAHYYFEEKEEDLYREELEALLPTLRKRDEKSRVWFILGQLYQRAGQRDSAFTAYKKVLKFTPPYEMAFHARLFMGQTVPLEDQKDVERMRKLFRRQLEDEKNEEYRDRIWYEMAKFELEQGDTPLAIDYLNNSIQESSSNVQKSYTYLKLGEISYEAREFREASAYYDSSTAIISPKVENYLEIEKRAKVLGDFVTALDVVELEDSLQRMAKMPREELDVYLDSAIAQKERAHRAKEMARWRAQQAANTPKPGDAIVEKGLGKSNFIFYNEKQLRGAQASFQERWGSRPLEDNWRRASKGGFLDFDAVDPTEEPDPTAPERRPVGDGPVDSLELLGLEPFTLTKEDILRQIPFHPDSLAASEDRSRESLYDLGRILHFKLEEPRMADSTYAVHQTRFPDSERYVEVKYLRYKLCEAHPATCNAAQHRNDVLTNHPTSLWAKLIENPAYERENREANREVHLAFEQAWRFYEQGEYFRAGTEAERLMKAYPYADITDRLVFLRILADGQSGDTTRLIRQLEGFIDTYDTSPLLTLAQRVLDRQRAIADGTYVPERVGPAPPPTGETLPGDWDFNLGEQHLVVFVFRKAGFNPSQAIVKFYDYALTNYPSAGLKINHYDLNEQYTMVKVEPFELRGYAKNFLQKIEAPGTFLGDYKGQLASEFLITFTNYEELLTTRDLAGYLRFYQERYAD